MKDLERKGTGSRDAEWLARPTCEDELCESGGEFLRRRQEVRSQSKETHRKSRVVQ
jgi:hypothetical protein